MLARSNPEMAFTSLNHYIDFEWVRYAYDCTRKDGAVGVDGQSGEDYAVNLTQNLLGLVDRLKSGRYRAQPVRRHFIAKADGSLRGLGIPSFEDKVAQRAIVIVPARIVWTRVCNSGGLFHGGCVTGFQG
jgi:RNA-directed DNA polymerase